MATNKETELLIDLGWLRTLDKEYQRFSDDVRSLSSMSDEELAMAWPIAIKHHKDMLAFLEAFVVTDRFICDGWAWLLAQGDRPDLNIPGPIKSVIQRKDPTSGVYAAALDAAHNCYNKLQEDGKTNRELEALFEAMKKGSGPEYFDHNELDLAQYLNRYRRPVSTDPDMPPTGVLRFFANSSSEHDVKRVFFYQSFARQMNLVPFLSKNKLEIVRRLELGLQTALHKEVVDKIERARCELNGDSIYSADIDIPPLAEMMLRSAITTGRDILDVATEIRESDNARKYREFLAELLKLHHAGSSGRPKYAKKVRELLDLAKIWGQQDSAEHGVIYRLRNVNFFKFKLEEYRYISSFFDALGFGSLAIKDPLLTKPQAHISFVASWYS